MYCKDLFFNILKSALWGLDDRLDASSLSRDDVMAALRIAKAQTVLGMVANEVMQTSSLSCLLNEADKAGLKRFVMSNLTTGQMLNNALINIVLELRKYGIEPVLLKGQGVAKYYPMPELRQCGDIDVYVGQDNFAKACEVIGEMSSPEDHQGDIPSLKHFHTRIGHAFIEIHRYTDVYWPKRYDRVYQKISDAGMHSDLVPLDFFGVPVMSPSVDFNVFFIFNHFWHHFIADGVGLRQLCDWVRLMHVNHGKINLDYLSDVLCKMRLMKEWQVFGYIAVNTLGLPADEMPFYDPKYKKTAEKVLELIMLEGNFGKENMKGYNRPKGYVAGKWYSFKKRFGRNLRVLSIFPMESFRHITKVFICGIGVMFSDKFKKYED